MMKREQRGPGLWAAIYVDQHKHTYTHSVSDVMPAQGHALYTQKKRRENVNERNFAAYA